MKLAVFVGAKGRGSNMMAVHAGIQAGEIPAAIAVVVGTDETAPALARARDAGLVTRVVRAKGRPDDEYAQELVSVLQEHAVGGIVLAGYLRRLPDAVVDGWKHKIVNIHPALLPAFGGKGMYGHHVHAAVLEYGAKVSGCTAHLVDNDYDTGPVVLQRCVPVHDDDTPESLAARVLAVEHPTLVEAVGLMAAGRLRVEGRCVRVVNRDDAPR